MARVVLVVVEMLSDPLVTKVRKFSGMPSVKM